MILAVIMGWFRTNPRNVWLIAGLVGVIALLSFVYLKGRGDADDKNEAARAVEVQEAISVDASADTKSLTVARQEAEKAADLKEELIDEVAKAPDDVPDESSVRYGCFQLRHQGRRVADIPACRALGFGG